MEKLLFGHRGHATELKNTFFFNLDLREKTC